MNSYKRTKSIFSWTVFGIATIVYFLTAERTGSLWDCGEFILGAYKLEVVHPPGAPLFMIIGRLFTWIAELVSNNPADIAFSVNLMSGICTAFMAFFVTRITMIFGRKTLVGDDEGTTEGQNLALGFAGLSAGLAAAFCTSIWFSAVEGEVYAMSTMFTAMTFWAACKWYELPNTKESDRWLVLCIYLGALSIGVHLLSLLTFPAIGVLVYLKKYEKHNLIGYLLSFICGSAIVIFIQKFVIVGIPTLWKNMELFAVNNLGMPFHSGLIFTTFIIGALIFFLLKYSHQKNNQLLQLMTIAGFMCVIGFSTIGVIVIRANADTPVNMNKPSDALRLLPYLNREQYGERPLVFGPHFDAKPKSLTKEERHGAVGDEYKIVDRKLDYEYDSKDKMFFPRIGHTDGSRPQQHREWYEAINGKKFRGKPRFGYNLQFFVNYQIGWMYWRYFMWNFTGRQNGEQGFKPWDLTSGHWVSGVKPIDQARLYNMSEMSDRMKNDPARNTYFFIPLIFGLIGLLFHSRKRPKEFMVLLTLFLITGLGLILYSNQPPGEPRERDYVLVGSFFTYCMWIGMAVLSLFGMLMDKANISEKPASLIAGLLIAVAPLLMVTQNWDDHDRSKHYGSRDYASNFLNSVDENAIIFTYGDNDTYPLWYAQEVEGIRRDVRVVNLSLIAVDWYIDKLRNKLNDSPPIKLTLPPEAYRGNLRNQVFFDSRRYDIGKPIDIFQEMAFIGNKNNVQDGLTVMRTANLRIPLDLNKHLAMGTITPSDSTNIVSEIQVNLPKKSGYIQKDQLAVLDLIASNINDRPIYFAVTCKNDKLLGMNDYMQMEGMALRLIPVRTPSDKSLSIYGSGKVARDKVYDNIMTKWKWGNFDKVETHISTSYAAELQAMKVVMLRTAQSYMNSGEKSKALDLARQFFKSFPNFNFPYDDSVTPFINIMISSGELEEAKSHMKILAEETAANMNFYNSLDDSDFNSFKQDFGYSLRAVSDILENAKKLQDSEFENEMNALLSQYDIRNIKG